MTEKPVSVALEEILAGEYVIVEPEEIRNIWFQLNILKGG
jgi:hypothetical protein